MHRVPLNEVPTALMQIELLRRAIERHQVTIDRHEMALAQMRANQTARHIELETQLARQLVAVTKAAA